MHGKVLVSTFRSTATPREAGGLCIFPSELCGSVGTEHFIVPLRDCAIKSWT